MQHFIIILVTCLIFYSGFIENALQSDELSKHLLNEVKQMVDSKFQAIEQKINQRLENVIGVPKFIANDNETIYQMPGISVILDCSFKNKVPFEIKWFKNGEEFEYNKQIFTTNILTFEDNNSIYECEVKNIFGDMAKKKFSIMFLADQLSMIFEYLGYEIFKVSINCGDFANERPTFILERRGYLLNYTKQENNVKNEFKVWTEIQGDAEFTHGIYNCHIKKGNNLDTFQINVIDGIPPKPNVSRSIIYFTQGKLNFNELHFFATLPKSKYYKEKFIDRITKVKAELQEIQLNDDGNVKNISEIYEKIIPFNQYILVTYDDEENPINMSDLNLKDNSTYRIKLAVRSNSGWSAFSDWYTFLTMHECGANLTEIFDGVTLKFPLGNQQFGCSSHLSTKTSNGVCAEIFADTCTDNLTFYDGPNENSPIISYDCDKDQDDFGVVAICSSSKHMFVEYKGDKINDKNHFKISFCPKKSKRVKMIRNLYFRRTFC
ncbi:hypothetical protein B4U79_19136 [Dinothrombium tinctorium]|uniref:Ig-like domain-containing protein n=1 Tax=Dinothrombium tinctorium TaxID=1965070 RepID=A0A3S3P764_9ACAR|nr:hypothetical protein B4U79_19137 [Dinothrombium tinctorium]RWS02577.1 hypothetical protein B4U79_19136 [Dinothrombium tinctorium]